MGLGPWSFDLSITQLAAFSAAMLLTALIVQMVSNYVSIRLTTGYFLRTRLEVVRAFQGSDWNLQAQEREGWLRTLSTDNVDASQAWPASARGLAEGHARDARLPRRCADGELHRDHSDHRGAGPPRGQPEALESIPSTSRSESAVLNVRTSEELAGLTMNARELKIYGVVSTAGERFRKLAQQQRAISLRSGFVEGIGAPVFRTAASLLIVALITVTATRDSSQVAAVGVVAVLLYRSSNYATVLVAVQQRLARIVPTMDQLEEGLNKLWSNQVTPGHLEPETFGVVQADAVSFRYPSQTTPAVIDVSLGVSTTEVVGIIGPSGGGKSTLAELLIGLRRPSDGR